MRAESPLVGSSVRRRGRVRPAFLKVALAASVAVFVGVLVGLAFAGSRHELAPGTRVAGVDVGGLDERQAVARLERRFDRVASVPVAFAAGSRSFSYAADQLGVEPNWHAAVAAAARSSGGFGPIRGFRRLSTRMFGDDVPPPIAYSADAVRFAVANIENAVERPPRDAALVRRGLRFEIRPGRLGQRVDRESASLLVVQALASLDRSSTAIVLPTAAVAPRVTASMLAPAARKAHIAVSAPVRVQGPRRSWRLSRWRVASVLELPSGGKSQLAIGGPGADAYFGTLVRRADHPPVDAHFAVYGTQLSVVRSRPGLELDVPATAQALLRAATSRTSRVARLVVSPVDPARTTEQALAMGIDRRMSTYKTYNAGTADRITNLRLGVENLDDTFVPPGGTFSLNRAIGERTAERGFRPAPVIIGTAYAEEVGGGTSQVATTVFNAAWEAGLEITERNPHALYISRYPLGRDATVYWPTLDLEFRNDTEHWILVKGFAESDGIRVSIYGGETRRVESSPGTMTITGAIPVKRVKDPSLPKGEKVVESEGEPPSRTTVTRKVYSASGKLLHDETWNTTYKAEAKVVLVGTKGAAKPKKGAKKTAAPAATGETTTTGAATTTTRP